VVLLPEADGHGRDAGDSGLHGTDAVGDPFGDEELVGTGGAVLVVEGVVGDQRRDVRVTVGAGEELLVLGLLPGLVARVFGGAGDEVDDAAAAPVREDDPVAEEVLDTPASQPNEEPGGERLLRRRAE